MGRPHDRRGRSSPAPATGRSAPAATCRCAARGATTGQGSRHDIGLDIEEVHSIIRDIPKPVIAAVNGYAIGGGHVLHVICDLTIAADTARFGQVGPKVGSVDPGFGTAYLARVVGEKKAREFWYLCEQYTRRGVPPDRPRQQGRPGRRADGRGDGLGAADRRHEPDSDHDRQAVVQHRQRVDPRRRRPRHQRAGAVLRHRRGDGGPAGVHRTATAELPSVQDDERPTRRPARRRPADLRQVPRRVLAPVRGRPRVPVGLLPRLRRRAATSASPSPRSTAAAGRGSPRRRSCSRRSPRRARA